MTKAHCQLLEICATRAFDYAVAFYCICSRIELQCFPFGLSYDVGS
jgi:hypothetical protein